MKDKTKIIKEDIVYRLSVKEDKEAVAQFLVEHFFPFEPLISCIKGKEVNNDFERASNVFTMASENGFCLIALYKEQIVGVRLCSEENTSEEQTLMKLVSKHSGTKLETLYRIFAAIKKDSNAFQRYNCDIAMDGCCLVVHKDFRGNGIGLELFDKSLKRAKTLGYELFISVCTSIYSARLAEMLDMECINVFNTEEYRAPDSGEQMVFPEEKQKFLRTYAKRLL